MISNKLNAFLEGFQTDNPMIPFMVDVLGNIVKDFLSRIILKDVLRKASDIYKLIQLDLQDKDIRKRSEDVDVGFAVKLKLEQAGLNSSDTKVCKFKQQAGEFLAFLLAHLFEKSLLKQSIVRSAVSANPLHMANKEERNTCINHFSIILQKFVSAKRIIPKTAELAKEQYQKFFDIVDQNKCFP